MATLFYLLVYAAATAGSFAALTYLSSPQRQVDSVDELAGLGQNYPKMAAALALFMFSLTGLPPLAGFWGKFTLFTGALGVDAKNPDAGSLWPWFLALAIVGAVNAAISAAYYLRIVGVMYFRPPGPARRTRRHGRRLGGGRLRLLVLGIGLLSRPAGRAGTTGQRSGSADNDPAGFPSRNRRSASTRIPVPAATADRAGRGPCRRDARSTIRCFNLEHDRPRAMTVAVRSHWLGELMVQQRDRISIWCNGGGRRRCRLC